MDSAHIYLRPVNPLMTGIGVESVQSGPTSRETQPANLGHVNIIIVTCFRH